MFLLQAYDRKRHNSGLESVRRRDHSRHHAHVDVHNTTGLPRPVLESTQISWRPPTNEPHAGVREPIAYSWRRKRRLDPRNHGHCTVSELTMLRKTLN